MFTFYNTDTHTPASAIQCDPEAGRRLLLAIQRLNNALSSSSACGLDRVWPGAGWAGMPESSGDIILREPGIGGALAQALAKAVESEARP